MTTDPVQQILNEYQERFGGGDFERILAIKDAIQLTYDLVTMGIIKVMDDSFVR